MCSTAKQVQTHKIEMKITFRQEHLAAYFLFTALKIQFENFQNRKFHSKSICAKIIIFPAGHPATYWHFNALKIKFENFQNRKFQSKSICAKIIIFSAWPPATYLP